MSEIKYFTPEGLQKLKDELDDLILRERPRIVQAIQEARDMPNTTPPKRPKACWKPRLRNCKT